MKTYITLFAFLISTIAFSQGTKKELQNLSGTYKSISVEDWGRGTFGFREFSFNDEKGNLYFGVRPADNNMCTADRRPTALLPAVAKR